MFWKKKSENDLHDLRVINSTLDKLGWYIHSTSEQYTEIKLEAGKNLTPLYIIYMRGTRYNNMGYTLNLKIGNFSYYFYNEGKMSNEELILANHIKQKIHNRIQQAKEARNKTVQSQEEKILEEYDITL